MVVSQTLTIQSVKVWTSNHTITGAKIMIINASNGTSVVSETPTVTLNAGASPHTMTVNLSLNPGTYYVGIFAPVSGGAGAGVWLEPNENFPSSQSGIFSIEGRCYANFGSGFNATQTPTHYGQLFDWIISTGITPACGRTPVVATVTDPANTGLTITSVSPICINTDGTINVLASESGVSYQPFIGVNTAGPAVGGTGSNVSLTVNQSNLVNGSNTITVRATKTGCGTTNMTSTPSILVNDTPVQPGDFTTSSPSVNQGQSGVVYTVPNVAGVTHNWSYSGTGGTINGTGNSITMNFSAGATSGVLSVTASNNCGTSAVSRDISITVNSVTNTSDPLPSASIKVYPNPFSENGTIELNLSSPITADLEIFDLSGMKVKTLFKNNSLAAGYHVFNIQELNTGTYIVKLKSEGKVKVFKIVKN